MTWNNDRERAADSEFTGYGEGAQRRRRAVKRAEAEERNARTEPMKRRAYRLVAAELAKLGEGVAA